MDPAQRHDYFVRMLAGIEIDPFAREVARLSLMLADYPNPDGWRLLDGDVFAAPVLGSELAKARAVLCNPPFEDFTLADRQRYRGLRSANKAADVLLRTIDRAPDLLGFVLPRPFIDGQYYREARRQLAQTYGSLEIVALPDSAFQHSRVETVLLIAHEKGHALRHLWSAEVAKKDYEHFVRSGRPTREEADTVPADDAGQSLDAPSLWLSPLRRIWRALDGLSTLADAADIRNGIYYRLSVKDQAEQLVSKTPHEGYEPGLLHVSDGFEPLSLTGHVYLNMDPSVMYEKSKAHLFPWHLPKVIVNGVRLSGGAWVMTGVPDRAGLVAYHLFHAMWSRGELPIEVLAAIVNGPVANAFMSLNRTSRHNRIETMNRIPIPHFPSETVDTISTAVADYRSARAEWVVRPFAHEHVEQRCRQALYRIDAELLTAYDLPPRLERELLDYFAGHRRPGPVEFGRYFPEGFRPSLPWRMYVSGALERAGAHTTLERLPVLRDPAISEMVAELG